MANAKARLSASFTRRPNGKWKMTFRFPLTSRYPSRRTCRSVGRDGINASCPWTYETRDCAEPASTWHSSINHSFAAFSPSLAIFAARSRRNSPTAIERSNERGNISPVHEGTVARRPDELERLGDGPPFLERHRDERLGEDVEGIARDVHPVNPGVVRGFR